VPGIDQPLLINILGHAAGALIFAIFLTLLASGRGWSALTGRYLSGLAALLAFGWNVGSLVALVIPGLQPRALDLVAAVSFSLLSLLPAVLLHLSLENSQPALVISGYGLSAIAAVMHFWELLGNGAALHQGALLLITVGFLLLAGLAAGRIAWEGKARASGARMMAAMCLALFAMSFVHFGAHHAGQAWSRELIVHHAGIPLALFVLLQDFRFVLLDAFVRFMANALLAAALTGILIVAAFRMRLVERSAPGPLQEALFLISVCLFLIFFAWLRNRVQSWLTLAVFRHGRVAAVAARLKECPASASENEYLSWAAATIAGALRTAEYAVALRSEVESAASLHAPVLAPMLGDPRNFERWSWAEAVVPVRLMQGDSRLIFFGRRQGGQRYLGEDLDSLAKAAAEIEDHVESLRREEMNRLVSQAELRALQSQINPHFLFNALNALYGTIPREASIARRMVLNLAEIFRYFLHSDKTFVPLSQEMQIVRAYLEVERCRLGSRLEVALDVDDAALGISIPVLSIQPLVENAIKHGVSLSSEPGYVKVRVLCLETGLHVVVENSAPGTGKAHEGPGVGLDNVRRRIEICYGQAAELTLTATSAGARAELTLPIGR
jgi:hypothetical protein